MTDYYIPPHMTQFDGSPCQSANCWACAGAWAHRGATGGAAQVTPTEFRKMAGGGSGRANKPGCPSGFEQDVVDGLNALGVKSAIIKVGRADARTLLTTPRRALFVLALDYDAIPDGKDCARSGDFDGLHMIGWVPGEQKPLMDPMCQHYRNLSVNLLLDAATLFSRTHGRGGSIWLVRVRRPAPPRPQQDPAQTALIEQLREQVAERDEWIARARALITDLATLEVPA